MAQKNQTASSSDDQSASATPSAQDASDSTQPATSGASTSKAASAAQKSHQTELDAALRNAQPTIKSSAMGLDQSSKDAAAFEAANPYGTRSRNRTGSSRPNYAEDKDLDVDMYDYAPEKKDQESKKSARHSNVSAASIQENARPNGSTRKALPSDDTKSTVPQNGAKDVQPANATPTTQTLASTNSTQPSKKRKAASHAAAATSQAHASATASSSGASTVASRKTASGPYASSYAETNMLSFENSGAVPRDGKLVADDGTVLAPNGKTATNHTRTFTYSHSSSLRPSQFFSSFFLERIIR